MKKACDCCFILPPPRDTDPPAVAAPARLSSPVLSAFGWLLCIGFVLGLFVAQLLLAS
jgi:hypothetical protein